jgi:hypothetical protein
LLKNTLALVCLLAAWSCSSSSKDSPTTPAPTPSASTTPLPVPTPTPLQFQAIEQGCTRGRGIPDASCNRLRTGSLFLADMNAAIDQVAREHPDYFNLSEQRGEGAYRLLKRDAYIAAVIDALGQRGLCAAVDMFREFFLVKRGDGESEEFAIEGPGSFLRRYEASYGLTCTPAAFPLAPRDVVVKMFVGLYGFECAPGIVPPHHDDKKLPLGCIGFVTATPKDYNHRSVPASVHGSEIEWFVRNGEHRIEVSEEPASTFNKVLKPAGLGEFSICATVLGVTECLNGQVIP